jgi:hypothetical protein
MREKKRSSDSTHRDRGTGCGGKRESRNMEGRDREGRIT